MQEETELIDRIIRGDTQALGWAYQRHSEAVLNHAWRILLDRQLAEDCLHDIFVRLPESLSGFRGSSTLSTWLYRTTHNRALEWIRNQGNRSRLLSLYAPEWSKDGDEDGVELSQENSDTLERLLSHLDPETRSLLWLKEAEGLEIGELSAVFHQPEGTIKSRLSRSRARLRELMEHMEAIHE